MKPSTVTTALIGFGAALLLAVGCHPGSSFLSLPGGPEATQSRAQLAAASPDMPMPGTHQLGTNLTGIADWSTQMPFIDAFKSSRPWISQCAETNSNCGWSTGEEDQLDLDEAGWVRSLPAESDAPQYTRVGTLLFRGVEDYPGGEYVVQYDGQGTLRYDYDAEQRVEDSRPGRDVIDVTPTGQGIYLQITATNPEDYIRNIRVVPAEYESTFEQAPFNPAFLEKTQPYSVLRFMDWMGTNNSEQGDWAERPKPSDATYAHRGVPVEVMVDLANRLERSPWFTMPHQATDTYVQEFARYVRQQLNPDLPIYVEFSNEVWNGQFDQQRYVVEQGRQLDVDEDDFARGRLWFGQRTAEVLQIWDEVFDSDSDRIVGVLGAQAANPWTAKKSLEYLRSAGLSNAEGGIDAIAIAPYIGLPLNRDSVQAELERWIAEGKDAALDRLFEEIITGGVLSEGYEGGGLQQTFDWVEDYVELTEAEGLVLVAYEGGQHLAPLHNGMQDNQALVDLFITANRDPRISEVYKRYFDHWYSEADGLFVHFADISKPGRWGSWGALENVYQESSPKYDALVDRAAALRTTAAVAGS